MCIVSCKSVVNIIIAQSHVGDFTRRKDTLKAISGVYYEWIIVIFCVG